MIFFFVSLVGLGLIDCDDDGDDVDDVLALSFSSTLLSGDLVKTHPVNTTSCSSLSFATSSATQIPKSRHVKSFMIISTYKRVCEKRRQTRCEKGGYMGSGTFRG